MGEAFGVENSREFSISSKAARFVRLRANQSWIHEADRFESPDAFEAKLVFSIAKMKSGEEPNGEAGRVKRLSVLCRPFSVVRRAWSAS